MVALLWDHCPLRPSPSETIALLRHHHLWDHRPLRPSPSSGTTTSETIALPGPHSYLLSAAPSFNPIYNPSLRLPASSLLNSSPKGYLFESVNLTNIPRRKSERFSLTIKDHPHPLGSYLGLSEPDQEFYVKGLKYYTCYYKWLTNPKNSDISGILMAFHPLLAFFVINANEVTFNDIAKFFLNSTLRIS